MLLRVTNESGTIAQIHRADLTLFVIFWQVWLSEFQCHNIQCTLNSLTSPNLRIDTYPKLELAIPQKNLWFSISGWPQPRSRRRSPAGTQTPSGWPAAAARAQSRARQHCSWGLFWDLMVLEQEWHNASLPLLYVVSKNLNRVDRLKLIVWF